MADLLQFPNERKQYALVGANNQEPVFVSDLVINAQNTLNVLRGLYNGFTTTDFRIVSGLVYNSIAHTYGEGVIMFGQNFYYVAAGLAEGKYLVPTVGTTISKTFQDTNPRDTYTIYYTIISDTLVAGSTPVFSNNMNDYRLNLYQLENFDTWHYVGESGEPAFGTNWGNAQTNSELAYDPLRFRKLNKNTLHIVGRVHLTTGAVPALFILPVGWRLKDKGVGNPPRRYGFILNGGNTIFNLSVGGEDSSDFRTVNISSAVSGDYIIDVKIDIGDFNTIQY